MKVFAVWPNAVWQQHNGIPLSAVAQNLQANVIFCAAPLRSCSLNMAEISAPPTGIWCWSWHLRPELCQGAFLRNTWTQPAARAGASPGTVHGQRMHEGLKFKLKASFLLLSDIPPERKSYTSATCWVSRFVVSDLRGCVCVSLTGKPPTKHL